MLAISYYPVFVHLNPRACSVLGYHSCTVILSFLAHIYTTRRGEGYKMQLCIPYNLFSPQNLRSSPQYFSCSFFCRFYHHIMQMMIIAARVLLVIVLQLSAISTLANNGHIESDRQFIARYSRQLDRQSLLTTRIADASATRYEKQRMLPMHVVKPTVHLQQCCSYYQLCFWTSMQTLAF